jgi:hypothetical protein
MAKHFALVLDGEITNIWRDRADTETAADVSPLNAANLIEVSADAQPGWRVDPATRQPIAPVIETPSVRQQRRAEYQQVLRREDGDDEITILGDTLDVLIKQVEALRQKTGSTATAEYADLIGKISAVKSKLPK